MEFKSISVLLFLFSTFMNLTYGQSQKELDIAKCIDKFDNDYPQVSEALSHCKAQLNLTELPETMMTLNETLIYLNKLEKADFDDKCFVQCILEKFNVLNEDFSINFEKMAEIHSKGNHVSNQTIGLVISSWKNCSLKMESQMKGKGDKKKDACKKLAAIDHCRFLNLLEIDLKC